MKDTHDAYVMKDVAPAFLTCTASCETTATVLCTLSDTPHPRHFLLGLQLHIYGCLKLSQSSWSAHFLCNSLFLCISFRVVSIAMSLCSLIISLILSNLSLICLFFGHYSIYLYNFDFGPYFGGGGNIFYVSKYLNRCVVRRVMGPPKMSRS